MEEEIKDFINESQDYIEVMEPKLINLLSMDNGEEKTELINMSFRNFHSIKGVAGFLGFTVIQDLTHKIEDLLNQVRNNKLDIDTNILDVILKSIDLLKEIIAQLAETGKDVDFKEKKDSLLEILSVHLNGSGQKVQKPDNQEKHKENDISFEQIFDCFLSSEMLSEYKISMNNSIDDISHYLVEYIKNRNSHDVLKKIINSLNKIRYNGLFFGQCELVDIAIYFEKLLLWSLEKFKVIHSKKLTLLMESIEWMKYYNNGGIPVDKNYFDLKDKFNDVLSQQIGEMESVAEPYNTAELAKIAKISNAEKLNMDVQQSKPKTTEQKVIPQDIRVDLDKLDKLVGLIETLNLTLSSVLKNTEMLENLEDNTNKNLMHAKITSDNLQDVAMSIRMVPVSNVFNKMFRLVHDTSKKLNKKVKLEVVGENTEVDRNLLHKIADPLVHLIRNSMDHGIESPEERKKLGKEEEGTVILKAYHSGGDVILEVNDDGAGLNSQKILNKALERGLIEEGQHLTEDEIHQLVLQPGFSTAEKVTNISGRGVGMDVCVKQIQKLNGKLQISSTIGKGTSFKIQLPVESTLVEGVLVRVGSMTYTIRTSFVQEILHCKSNQLVVTPTGEHFIKVRSELYKIMHLAELFKKKSIKLDLENSIVILVEQDKQIYGLVVDEILGKTQGVVKPLPKIFKGINGVAGCSLTGTESHQVSWIVDVNALTQN